MTLDNTLAPDTQLANAAASAAAQVLPAVTPLTAAGAQPGNEHVAVSFAGACVAQLDGPDGRAHRVAVLVGQDLVSALAESPLGGLDLSAATQPAIDAAAAVLGVTARAGTQVDPTLVVGDLAGPFTVVPLVGQGIDAAVLLTDSLLQRLPVEVAEPVVVVEQVAQPAAPTPPTPPTGQYYTPDPATSPFSGVPAAAPAASASRGIEMLAGVDMEVTVELGRTRMTVRELLALTPGTVLELDRAADGPADLLVNGRLIARGEVVVVDEDFGLRITEIVQDSGA